MTTITFDTLKFATRLEDAGVSSAQAKAEAEVLRELLDERDKALTALQAQMQALSSDTQRDVQYMANKTDVLAIKTDVLGVRAEVLKVDAKVDLLRKDMEALGKDMTLKMSGMFIVAIGILLAGMRYLLT